MLANKADPAAIYSFSQSLISILNSNYTMNYTNGILEHKLGSPQLFYLKIRIYYILDMISLKISP